MIHYIPKDDIFPHEESLECECAPQLIHEKRHVIAEHRTFSGMHLFKDLDKLSCHGKVLVTEKFLQNVEDMSSSGRINKMLKKKLIRDMLNRIFHGAA